MTYTTTMTSKGQITVPAPIRKKLGLKPGASLSVDLKGNTAVVKVDDWQKNLAKLQARLTAHRKKHNIPALTDEELDQAINDAAQQAAIERYQRSLRDG